MISEMMLIRNNHVNNNIMRIKMAMSYLFGIKIQEKWCPGTFVKLVNVLYFL